MAFCASCGHQISDVAVSCPSCGHPTASTTALYGTPGAPGVPGLAYASFGQRFAGWFVDELVLITAGFLIRSGGPFTGLVIGFMYHWLMLAFNDGRTLGKMALGIRIARPDGSPVDLGTAATRAAMAMVSGLALGLGYLWAAWDPEHRTWHDMVANTRAFNVGRR